MPFALAIEASRPGIGEIRIVAPMRLQQGMCQPIDIGCLLHGGDQHAVGKVQRIVVMGWPVADDVHVPQFGPALDFTPEEIVNMRPCASLDRQSTNAVNHCTQFHGPMFEQHNHGCGRSPSAGPSQG